MARNAAGAIGYGEQSLEHFLASGDRTGTSWALIWLSYFHEQNGSPEQALSYSEEALELASRRGNQIGITFALNRLDAQRLGEAAEFDPRGGEDGGFADLIGCLYAAIVQTVAEPHPPVSHPTFVQ